MKLIINLLLCSLFIGSISSQATEITQKPILIQDQETQQNNVRPYGQAFIMIKKIICNDSEVLLDLLKSEPGPQVPIFYGIIKNPQGDTIGVTQIFIDKENHRFSIVESSPQGISCIVSAGSDFDILSHEKKFLKGSFQKIKGQN
jgi:hypothetical protein